ncbi:EfeM/EfeO family lipoprotein [Streptomyces sp. NPDC051173]|uniref:EfeM/EfeO family lipoprotein n=1 Tax=Streptomyces sp. NPDC051173 TaxID=3155164 RepID=UPI00345066FF
MVAVLAAAAPSAARPPRAPALIEISPGACGAAWPHPRPGAQTFVLHNTSATATEARLVDRTGAVHAEAEALAPGTHRALRARLGPGAYAFVCLPDDADAVTGPTVRIAGPARGSGGGPAAVPLTSEDLVPAALDYQRWVGGRMAGLVTATDALRAAVERGDRAAARAAWLPAHLGYERLGAAYGAFGDTGSAVDGTAAGLPGGVRDPEFTGFHRVEHGLWHGERGPALRRAARRLATDVRTLRDTWDRTRMDPAELGLRAHEILEDTLEHELTGRTDHGSGTNLATARANLDGTRAVLDRLRPLLRGRHPDLAGLDRHLARAAALLDRQGPRPGHPRWTPLTRLARADRERVDAAVADLVERLAPVATLCEPRRAP